MSNLTNQAIWIDWQKYFDEGKSNINNHPWQTITTTSTGTNYQPYMIDDDTEKMKEYIDFAFELMGIDMTFEKFSEMDESEKKKFIRNQKLKKLL